MKRYVGILAVALFIAAWPLSALAQETTSVDQTGSFFDQLLNMSPIAVYMLLCGIVLPFAIAAINRCDWSSFAKLITTVVACTAASFGWFLFHGDVVPVGKWIRLTLLVFAGATLFYKAFKPAVKEVEAKTG